MKKGHLFVTAAVFATLLTSCGLPARKTISSFSSRIDSTSLAETEVSSADTATLDSAMVDILELSQNENLQTSLPESSAPMPMGNGLPIMERTAEASKQSSPRKLKHAKLSVTNSYSESKPDDKPQITAQTSSLPVSQPAPTNANGTFVYYCPAHMLENTDNCIAVSITTAEVQQAIAKLRENVVNATGKSEDEIDADVKGIKIAIATKMKVEVKYDEEDFKTIDAPQSEYQIFDGVSDMNWYWIVKPRRVGRTQVSFVISAYDEQNGQWAQVEMPKVYTVQVKIDPRGYFAKLWDFLGDNPEWIFVQVVFPLAAYFWGKKQGKQTA